MSSAFITFADHFQTNHIMKKKYTKAKVEIISMKTEAFICASKNNDATASGTQKGEGTNTPFGAKEFNGTGNDDFSFDGNGVNDFPSDSIPPTKE